MSKLLSGLSVVLSIAILVGFGYFYWVVGVDSISYVAPIVKAPVVVKEVVPPTKEMSEPIPQAPRITGITTGISAEGGFATGVVIDSQTVLTVAHVVQQQKIVLVDVGRYTRRWVPAAVVGMIPGTVEPIVVLQLMGEERFNNKRNFKIGTGIKIPRLMVTPRGVFDWNPGTIVPGDSGGAVLNLEGELIGLVTGFVIRDRQNVVTMFR